MIVVFNRLWKSDTCRDDCGQWSSIEINYFVQAASFCVRHIGMHDLSSLPQVCERMLHHDW